MVYVRQYCKFGDAKYSCMSLNLVLQLYTLYSKELNLVFEALDLELLNLVLLPRGTVLQCT